jgi:acetylornithine/N-succinyldiaminopimelate aminotransferase
MKENIMEHSDQIMASTYKRFPVLMTRGQGCTLWDDQGKSYTDFVAGIAVCNLGHVHPAVTKALCLQANTLWHVSNLFYTEPQVRLAAWLVKNSFADRVFLETAALKLMKLRLSWPENILNSRVSLKNIG